VTGAGGAAKILALEPSTLNSRLRNLALNDLLDTAFPQTA
jgi:hypothetical protein